MLGSYDPNEVIFLLKNINGMIKEEDTKTREEKIQSGIHYSTMLPKEYKPSKTYMDYFYTYMKVYSKQVALYTAVLAEKIANLDKKIVLVSLARAGTPAGILLKRYLEFYKNIKIDHYSISIIRGKGIDENALNHILKLHPKEEICFVDAWTGKGAITKELEKSCKDFNKKYNKNVNPTLAVIADPGYCSNLFGTREDFLIPSACLNSTVSGLISRTVYRDDLISKEDFHGVKFYEELFEDDVSNFFVDTISSYFDDILKLIKEEIIKIQPKADFRGLKEVENIMKCFELEDVNLVKPGVGETTRVLLRRIPDKILVRDFEDKDLAHIFELAREKNVKVEKYPLKSYKCCGIIRDIKDV